MSISTGHSNARALRRELDPGGDQLVISQQPPVSTTESDKHASTDSPPPDFSPERLREDDYSDPGLGDEGPLKQTQLWGGIARGLGLKGKPFKIAVPLKNRPLLQQTKLCFDVDSTSPEIVEVVALKRKRVRAKDKKSMVQISLLEDENKELDPATWGESELLPTTTINKTWAMKCYHLSKSEIEELDFEPVPRKGGKMHLYNAREVEYRAWQKYGGPKWFARALDVMKDNHTRNHRRGVFRAPKWRRFTVYCRGKAHVVEMLIYALKKKIEDLKKGRTCVRRPTRKFYAGTRVRVVGRK